MDALFGLRLEQPTEATRQATEFVRELIASGRLMDGDRIPPTAELARHWNIRVAGAHEALAALVSEGLLVRQPGKGTFVRRRKPALTAAAVYVLGQALANQDASFIRVVLAELQRQLNDQGIEVSVVIDPRAREELGSPCGPLARLARGHKVGAVIVLTADARLLGWTTGLPVPVAMATHEGLPGSVAVDHAQMVDLCLGVLAEQGCRSVGLMCGLPSRAEATSRSLEAFQAVYGHFADTASDAGLRIVDDWIMAANVYPRAGTWQEHGYVGFHKLWRHASHPDGLIVFPDSYMPGVLLAMAELRVRAPEHIRLAYHRNEQTPLLSPYPATEAVFSEKAMAAALIAQAKRLWAGEDAPPIAVGFMRKERSVV